MNEFHLGTFFFKFRVNMSPDWITVPQVFCLMFVKKRKPDVSVQTYRSLKPFPSVPSLSVSIKCHDGGGGGGGVAVFFSRVDTTGAVRQSGGGLWFDVSIQEQRKTRYMVLITWKRQSEQKKNTINQVRFSFFRLFILWKKKFCRNESGGFFSTPRFFDCVGRCSSSTNG